MFYYISTIFCKWIGQIIYGNKDICAFPAKIGKQVFENE